MKIFEFTDYRAYLVFKIKDQPTEAKGSLTKLAVALGIHPSYLSQILNGNKNLSQEQGWLVGEYFRLDELESRYFDLLISLERATKKKFKEHIESELEKMKADSLIQSGQAAAGQPLDERNQAIFYSNWHYSAIQLACGIGGGQTPRQISERLKLDLKAVTESLNFLVEVGLLKVNKNVFSVGLRRTHLNESSPIRVRHQTNWRLKAIEKMPNREAGEKFFTAPMRIDAKSYEKLRQMVEDFIKEVNATIDEAGDEELACMNIDLFKW